MPNNSIEAVVDRISISREDALNAGIKRLVTVKAVISNFHTANHYTELPGLPTQTLQPPPDYTRSDGTPYRFISKEELFEMDSFNDVEETEKNKFYKNFIRTFSVKIDNGFKRLNLDHEKDYLAYKCLVALSDPKIMQQPIVATNTQQVNPNVHKFVMVNEEQEAEIKNKSRKVRVEAERILDQMTGNDRRNYLKAKGVYPESTGGLTSRRIDAILFDEIENRPQEFLRVIRNKEVFNIKVHIFDAINKGIISENSGLYYYGTNCLGTSQDEIIKFWMNPNNSRMVLTIVDRLNDKIVPEADDEGSDSAIPLELIGEDEAGFSLAEEK